MEKWKHLRIPLADIKNATNSFVKEIGRGGYGSVYEGKLKFRGKLIKIAAKKLNKKHGQGLKEFLTEIDLLSGQQHENIITLIGYCDEGKEKIIVYEHVEHGSLDRYIRCSNTSGYTLRWLHRLKIVVEAARGLDHLHNHLHNNQVIIHRDIKSSNILLDHNWVAKISDLGISKSTFSGFGRTTVISNPCGTDGYVEPEYIRYGLVSKKSDVYSFGMVLFEVLCGRLCTTRDDDGILLFGDLVKEYYVDNKLHMLIDPSLRKQMSEKALIRYSAIAYKCMLARKDRPTMEDVKEELEEMLKLEGQVHKIQRFTLDEINQATVRYAVQNLLEDNSRRFVKVYRSNISGREVAMKRLHMEKAMSFRKEIDLLCSCDHANIISLVGYCDERCESVLVYEYMSNGSLYDYLCKHKSLTMEKCLEICIGVAKGLNYLHSNTHFSIIHGDISSENILLDHNLVPKISNFKSSTFHVVSPSVSQVIPNTIQGTKLNLATESYETEDKLRRKDDVHAFGEVLYDVLKRGKFRPVTFSLATISGECLRECEILILRCLAKDPDERPVFSEVIERLELALKLQMGRYILVN